MEGGALTSKERLVAALENRQADRLPVTTHHIMPFFLDKYMDGISNMEFFDRFGQENLYGSSSEVAALEALLKDIEAKVPADPVQQLQRQLADAVEQERYEDAARLRDAIHRATEGEGGA